MSDHLKLHCIYTRPDMLAYFADVYVPFIGKTKAGTALWTDIFGVGGWKAAKLEPGQREWHTNPNPAISVLLGGCVETSVGGAPSQVRRSAPGDVSLSLDALGQGHLTNVIGPDPAFALIMLLTPAQVDALAARVLGWPADIMLPETWSF